MIFTGFLKGEELNAQFKNANIGISILALYRKSLNGASDLKTREYMSKGLTVIGTGADLILMKKALIGLLCQMMIQ